MIAIVPLVGPVTPRIVPLAREVPLEGSTHGGYDVRMPAAPTSRRLVQRLVQLYVGLTLFGVSMAMLVLAGLGNMPWDVLHEGLARHTALSMGAWVVITSGAVLVLWIPLKVRPGLATISNVLMLGVVLDATLSAFDAPSSLGARIALLVGGVVVNGVSTGMYIGARYGTGPRDGLMIGLSELGLTVRAARTLVEVVVVIAGTLLGGTLGIGTLLYAVAIGPLAHVFIPKFWVADAAGTDGARASTTPPPRRELTRPSR